MEKYFISLKGYCKKFPNRAIPTLPDELREILKYPIGEENATSIIKGLANARLFKTSVFTDQVTEERILRQGSIPPEAYATIEFWARFDQFCAALVRYFSTDAGKKFKPQPPHIDSYRGVGGTDPFFLERGFERDRWGDDS